MSSEITFNTLLDTNKTIALKCVTLVKEHNKMGFKVVAVPNINQTTLSVKKTNNLFHDQLITFFNEYSTLIRFLKELSSIIEDMSYDMDDLLINFDRSPMFIYELGNQLDSQKEELQQNYNILMENQDKIINKFCDFIRTEYAQWEINESTIELLFKMIHMDFGFVTASRLIFSLFYELKLINTVKIHEQIKELTNELKLKCLGLKKKELNNGSSKSLQTFNLTPTTNNISLSNVIERLFSVNASNLTLSTLANHLKLISKERNENVSIILIVKENNDIYFDIDNLFNQELLQTLTSVSGVTETYINAFNTLKINNIASKHKDTIHTYNYTDKSNNIYVLWSNDLKNFKLREKPVSQFIANKIVNQIPSEIINLRNAKLEDIILSRVKENKLISFKQIKYLSFDNENEERTFIDKLCKEVINYFKKKIGKKKQNESLDFVSSYDTMNELHELFQREFKLFKPFHTKKEMPLQPLLIYTNNTIQLTNRIKKEMADWANHLQPIDSIDDIINKIINSNDNIYTKFIASYYLAMSGN